MDNNIDFIETMKNDTGFIKNNNYKVISIDDDKCIVEGKITNTSLNPFNIAHGGYIFGLADTAGGLIVIKNKGVSVTSSSTINYLSKGKGNKLIAEAKIIKLGKNISTCEVDIKDEHDTLVAKAILEYFSM